MCEALSKNNIGVMSDIEKNRFDLAWKWFAYHAEQRMKAFNFMILTFGVLATAIVTCIDKGLKPIGIGICIASIAIAGLFYLLDKRNQALVEFGRSALKEIEYNVGFVSSEPDAKTSNPPEPKLWTKTNILTLAYPEEKQGENISWLCRLLDGKHSTVLPAFTWVFIAIFTVALLWLIVFSSPAPDGYRICLGHGC